MVAKWPLAYRRSLTTLSLRVHVEGEWFGGMRSNRCKKVWDKIAWSAADVCTLAKLVPNLVRLRLEAEHLDRDVFDALLTLPIGLQALYLVFGHAVEETEDYPRPMQPVPTSDDPEWQRFSRFTSLSELVIVIGSWGDWRDRPRHKLSEQLVAALPRTNLCVLDREREGYDDQVGFDIRAQESDSHEFGGLRPLHRALLPDCMEVRACPSSAGGSTLTGSLLPVAQAWHMHAVLQSHDQAQGGREALLRGPLAAGEGPSEWCATLRAARAALPVYAHRRTGRQEEDDDEGEDDEEDDEEDEED